jgi:hypothetical protein
VAQFEHRNTVTTPALYIGVIHALREQGEITHGRQIPIRGRLAVYVRLMQWADRYRLLELTLGNYSLWQMMARINLPHGH